MVRTRSSPAVLPLREVNFQNNENILPSARKAERKRPGLVATPFTPGLQYSPRCKNISVGKVDSKADRGKSNAKTVSPVLQNLMLTPGRTFKTQQLLMQKHHEAKSRAGEKCVGGGISLWPEMDNMRLTAMEIWTLLANSITLLVVTVAFFYYLHGETIDHLNHLIGQLHSFTSRHPLVTTDDALFHQSLMRWHEGYSALLKNIDRSVEVSWRTCPPTYPLVIFLYVSGVITLLFYLYENVFAKSRLTPSRIKQWVCLLVVIMTWTFLMLFFLIQAQNLENLVQRNVHSLNEYMEALMFTEMDLTKYDTMLRYWTTRCLPPQTAGALTILGVVSVQNFTYYLIYYSVPIVTALFTPVVKLIMSLYTIYKPHPD